MAPSGGCPLIEDTKAKTVAELPSGEEEAEEQVINGSAFHTKCACAVQHFWQI